MKKVMKDGKEYTCFENYQDMVSHPEICVNIIHTWMKTNSIPFNVDYCNFAIINNRQISCIDPEDWIHHSGDCELEKRYNIKILHNSSDHKCLKIINNETDSAMYLYMTERPAPSPESYEITVVDYDGNDRCVAIYYPKTNICELYDDVDTLIIRYIDYIADTVVTYRKGKE